MTKTKTPNNRFSMTLTAGEVEFQPFSELCEKHGLDPRKVVRAVVSHLFTSTSLEDVEATVNGAPITFPMLFVKEAQFPASVAKLG